MSKKREVSIDNQKITLAVRTGDNKDIETTIPYIKQASINHTLPASVANSAFTIVLPAMDLDLGSLLFTIGGRVAYITAVIYPQKPGTENVDQITSDRIREEFRVGDKITVWTFITGSEGLVRGCPSELITITEPE